MDPQVAAATIGAVATILAVLVKVHRDNRHDHETTAEVVREIRAEQLDMRAEQREQSADIREMNADIRGMNADVREIKTDVREHSKRLSRLETTKETS